MTLEQSRHLSTERMKSLDTVDRQSWEWREASMPQRWNAEDIQRQQRRRHEVYMKHSRLLWLERCLKQRQNLWTGKFGLVDLSRNLIG